jgi:hypothetical protein
LAFVGVVPYNVAAFETKSALAIQASTEKRFSYKNLIDFKNWINSSNLSAKLSN